MSTTYPVPAPIFRPSVYLVGRSSIDGAELSRFLDDHEVSGWTTDTEIGAEKLVEMSGRLCYMSFAKPRPGGNAAYIDHILECKHGSVLEHAVFSLTLTGVSRSLTHELVRHRAGFAYSQLSQRYVDESEVEFVVPPFLADEVRLARQHIADCGGSAGACYADCLMGDETRVGLLWLRMVEDCRDVYCELSDYGLRKLMGGDDRLPVHPEVKTQHRKQAREAARSVLPNATETKIVATANARAWRHFIEMRGALEADAEIRRLAIEVWVMLNRAAPNLFGDYFVRVADGSEWLEGKHAKV